MKREKSSSTVEKIVPAPARDLEIGIEVSLPEAELGAVVMSLNSSATLMTM